MTDIPMKNRENIKKKEGRGVAGMLMVMDMIPFGNGKAMDHQKMD